MPAIYGGGAPNGESRVLIDIILTENNRADNQSGIALPPNGKLYCVLINTIGKIFEFDTNTKQFRYYTDFVVTGTSWASTLGADGCIYAAPESSLDFIKIDISSERVYVIKANLNRPYSYGLVRGLALAPNGNLYTDNSFSNGCYFLQTFPGAVDYQKIFKNIKNFNKHKK